MDSLTIYASPTSQPCRSVIWLCLIKGLPFKLGEQPDFDAGLAAPESLTAPTGGAYARGLIPAIDDKGFQLGEMPAIMVYLSDKHNWDDVYPRNLEVRAKLNEYLHLHHSFTRLVTNKLMAPHVVGPLMPRYVNANPLSMLDQEVTGLGVHADNPLEAGGKVAHTIIRFFERNYFDESSPFLCRTRDFSIADLACYEEIGQLRFANLFDFNDFPKTVRWLDAMSMLPFHDVAHAYNIGLGDIRTNPNEVQRFTQVVDASVSALFDTGLVS